VGLAAMPAIAFADELVDGVPTVLVYFRALGGSGRLRHHLPPEEAHQVRFAVARQHAARDINLRRAIVVEVVGVGAPSPAAHLDALLRSGLGERAIAAIAV